MADDLGARLVQAGLVTRDQLAEVLGAAPPHEGALVVGLADRGLAENALAGFFVAAGFGPLMEPEDLSGADPRAVRMLPAKMAVQLYALPVRLSAAGLVVAMAAPTDRHAVAEISRATGSEVLPTVARVGELRRALREAHPDGPPSNPPLSPESEPPVLELVNVRKPGRRVPQGDGYLGSTRGAERVEARALVGRRPASEDEDDGFVPLVRHKPVSQPTRGYPRERKIITRTFEKLGKKRDEKVVPVGQDRRSDGEWAKGPASRPPPPPPPAAKAKAKSEPPAAPPRSIIPPEHERWDLDDAPENKVDPDKLRRIAPRRPSRPPRPAPIGGTLSAIRASRDRDEVVELACRAALTVSRAAVLLARRKNVLKGVDGAGVGLSRDAVRNLWIPTSSPSMFRDVISRGEPYQGSPGTSAADGLFRAALGSRGGTVALQPVAVGTKVVAVLAADDLRYADEGLERLEVLAKAVGEAFERIIVASKK
jgi:hypothetical protein